MKELTYSTAKRGPGGNPDPIRMARITEFHLHASLTRCDNFTDDFLSQLSQCRSDEARRIILGVSK